MGEERKLEPWPIVFVEHAAEDEFGEAADTFLVPERLAHEFAGPAPTDIGSGFYAYPPDEMVDDGEVEARWNDALAHNGRSVSTALADIGLIDTTGDQPDSTIHLRTNPSMLFTEMLPIASPGREPCKPRHSAKVWLGWVEPRIPLRFWLLRADALASAAQAALAMEMGVYYYEGRGSAPDYLVDKNRLVKDALVVAAFKGSWNRARIMGINMGKGMAELHFLDYGACMSIPFGNIRYMHLRHFVACPAQAIPIQCLSLNTDPLQLGQQVQEIQKVMTGETDCKKEGAPRNDPFPYPRAQTPSIFAFLGESAEAAMGDKDVHYSGDIYFPTSHIEQGEGNGGSNPAYTSLTQHLIKGNLARGPKGAKEERQNPKASAPQQGHSPPSLRHHLQHPPPRQHPQRQHPPDHHPHVHPHPPPHRPQSNHTLHSSQQSPRHI